MKDEAAWLAQTPEEPIAPGQPIIDAHHHLYPASADDPHAYDIDDYLADIRSGHHIVGSVHVEWKAPYDRAAPPHLQPVGETRWVQSRARQAGHAALPGAIVGYADLLLAEAVDEVLAQHVAAAPERFRGIRYGTAADPAAAALGASVLRPAGLLADPRFRRGFACLAGRGLVFDAWLYHPQIAELTALARAFPATTIVLDHLGAPLGAGPYAHRRQEVFAQWERALRALAGCPNVYLKLGGSTMPCAGGGWRERARPAGSDELVAALRDYYHAAIDLFSPARCMFESNFPVEKKACSYVVVWNFFKKLAQGYSTTERDRLFHGTAAQVYRLPTTAAAQRSHADPGIGAEGAAV